MKIRNLKRLAGSAAGLAICAAMFLGTGTVARAEGLEYTNAFSLENNSAVTIDGNFSDWDSLPCSYEYNYDNSDNSWYWGMWTEDGECYMSEPGTFNTDVRHKMQLYCDGEYVYLHIVYATAYKKDGLNGNDFKFYVNGAEVAFQVMSEDGVILKDMNGRDPGLYPLDIRHENTGLSFLNAEDTNGYLRLTEDKINNEIEIRIPLAEMQRQNPAINMDTISTIEFFTHNLMYRRITAVGTSSGPLVLSALCGSIVLCGWFGHKRKNDGHLQV